MRFFNYSILLISLCAVTVAHPVPLKPRQSYDELEAEIQTDEAAEALAWMMGNWAGANQDGEQISQLEGTIEELYGKK